MCVVYEYLQRCPVSIDCWVIVGFHWYIISCQLSWRVMQCGVVKASSSGNMATWSDTIHTHPFNVLLSRTTQVSWYEKGKTNLDFTEARDSEWRWHQLNHMQVCTSLQTDNHASTPPLSFLQAGCPSCRPTNSVKALKARRHDTIQDNILTCAQKLHTLSDLLSWLRAVFLVELVIHWNRGWKVGWFDSWLAWLTTDQVIHVVVLIPLSPFGKLCCLEIEVLSHYCILCIQGFDTVGWASGRASGL